MSRRFETRQHRVEIAPPRDGAEPVGLQGVDGYVDAFHAHVLQRRGKVLEPAAVGGERQLLQAAAVEVARQPLEQPHDVAAHERLARR